MRRILVDSSIWISYFKSEDAHSILDELIQKNLICVNNLILSELIPFIHVKKEKELINLLLEIPIVKVSINWELIMNVQIQNLKNGINNVGIPYLIIVDNVISNNLILFSEDKHFKLMKKHLDFDLFNKN